MDKAPANESKKKTRVVIVEDQVTVRDMLSAILGAMPEFEVVGEAEDVDQALRLVARLEPDVVVLDWIFPGGGGGGFLRAMQANRLRIPVLVMSADTDDSAIREALTSGARGYIEKTADFGEFMQALRTVSAGGVYFGPLVAGIVERIVKRPETPLPPRLTVPTAKIVAGN